MLTLERMLRGTFGLKDLPLSVEECEKRIREPRPMAIGQCQRRRRLRSRSRSRKARSEMVSSSDEDRPATTPPPKNKKRRRSNSHISEEVEELPANDAWNYNCYSQESQTEEEEEEEDRLNCTEDPLTGKYLYELSFQELQ